MNIYIGAMSGTSCDGVDVVALSQDLEIIQSAHYAYPTSLKNRIQALQVGARTDISELLHIRFYITRCYIRAIAQLHMIPMSAVKAIGVHGQTLAHMPGIGTWQCINPHDIVAQIGVPVVCDFRGYAVAQGGQGAPLAPLFHQVWFLQKDVAGVVNIGGIANVTQFTPELQGVDTGPGNTLMDAWIREHKGCAYDGQGAWAKQGQVIDALLKNILQDPYFLNPSSTGQDYFNLHWLRGYLKGDESPEDVQATLLALTVHTIVMHAGKGRLVVCGGGAYNTYLMTLLSDALNGQCVLSDAYGIPANLVEAAGFAWLAQCHMEGRRHHISEITGQHAARLGVLHMPVT